MSINDVINFQRFIELVTLLSTFVMSPKLLRPSFKIFCDANKSLWLTELQLRQVQTLSDNFKLSFLIPQEQVLLLA